MTADELSLKLRGLKQWGQVLNNASPTTSSGACQREDSLLSSTPQSGSENSETLPLLHGILVASVVPHLNSVLAKACRKVFGITPAFIGDGEVKTGMAVDYKNPHEIGADRIANAVAARERFGHPVIVIDCGTATTFDVVSPKGHYAGGLILPGVELALAALSDRAARLPEVSFSRTATLIGRDTVSSMQAGSYWGAVEALSGIIRRLHTISGYQDAPVIATGGQATNIVEDISNITEYRPRLTLEGLLLLATRHFG